MDHTSAHRNNDTNSGNMDTADLSEQVAGTKTLENNGTSTFKEETHDDSVSSQLEDLLDKNLGLGPANVSGKSSLPISSLSSLAEDDDLDLKKSTLREKPYVSKAERRKLKKGQSTCESTSDPQNGEYVKKLDNSQHEKGKDNTKAANGESIKKLDNSQHEKGKDNTKAAHTKTSRGQKGKLKKIKEKYAEQDEEEREIRMALLAVRTLATRLFSFVLFAIALYSPFSLGLTTSFIGTSLLEKLLKRTNLHKMEKTPLQNNQNHQLVL
jgi:hypothetical protein